MNNGLRRRCKSGVQRSMHKDSMLQSKASFRCTQMSDSKFSSENIEFCVDPLSPFARTPSLTLSAVACTRRWEHFQCP